MIPVPTLYPYQQQAVNWLSSRKNALLALEMGLGKTAVSIRAASLLQLKRILVVCPAIAVPNWKEEFIRFWNTPEIPTFHALSYASLHKLPSQETYDLAILDECHFLKSPEALRTAQIFGKTGLLRRVKRAWCLSGTPAPNHAGELWVMLKAFGYTSLSYPDFIQKFCVSRKIRIAPGQFRHQIFGTNEKAIPELKALLKTFMLRKKKEDKDVNLQLPPITFETFYVDKRSDEEFDFEYESFIHFKAPLDRRTEFFKQMEKDRDMIQTLLSRDRERHKNWDTMGLIQSLGASVSTFRRFIGLAKVPEIARMVDEELKAKLYEKIVIFAVHRDTVIDLAHRLRRHQPVFLFGGTNERSREQFLFRFRKQKSTKVLIANIATAGTAINLTSCNQVLFAEQSWVPGENAQAAMRCHRIGQKNPVTVRIALSKDPLEQRIDKALHRKAKELLQIFDENNPLYPKSVQSPENTDEPIFDAQELKEKAAKIALLNALCQ